MLILSQWPEISALAGLQAPERRGRSHFDLAQGGWIGWENSNFVL